MDISPSHAQSAASGSNALLGKLPFQRGDEKIQTLYDLSKSQDLTPQKRVSFARQGLKQALQDESKKMIAMGYHVLGIALFHQSITSLDSASILFDTSYRLARQWNLPHEQVQALLYQARMLTIQRNYLKAMELTEESARLAESIGDSSLVAQAYVALSLRYHEIALDSMALSYAQQALNLTSRKRDEVVYGMALNHMAISYDGLNALEKSLTCWKEYGQIAAANRMFLERGFCYLNMAAVYQRLGNREEGLRITYENLRFGREHGLRNIEASALAYLAGEHLRSERYDSVIFYKEAANKIWNDLNFSETEFFLDNELDIAYARVQLGYVQEGLAKIMAHYQVARKRQFLGSQKRALKMLSDSYARLDDYKQANHYLSEWIQINDSLQSEERLQERVSLEYRYTLTRAAREKQLISRENESNKALIRQKNITQFILIGAIGILMVSIILIIRLFRQKLRVNRELAISNTTIAQQKEELEAALDNSLRMQQQLIHSEKMASLGQLTAGIAHEINNPLNFISGGASALEGIHNDVLAALKNPQAVDPQHMEALAGEMKTIMDVIKNGVSRSTNIIKDLRTFSSPIDQIRKDSRTNLKSAVTSAIVLMNSKIQNANITVETDLKDLVAHANESLIQQVLVNLLDNAVHALEGKPNDRRIWIQTEAHANRHHIHVRDNGPGIPPEHQARILEPFFTTKEVGKGTGLGLAISYGIIQKHGGDLRFTSEVGKGTEFIISLPTSN